MTEQPTTPPGPERPEEPDQPPQLGRQRGEPDQPAPAPATAPKRLLRSRNDRMLGGVCGGVAEYLGIDSTLLRILVVVGTVVGFGSLLVAYIIGWILIPEAD
jgi:phage shock protein C